MLCIQDILLSMSYNYFLSFNITPKQYPPPRTNYVRLLGYKALNKYDLLVISSLKIELFFGC
jgi:hypothetical protein